VPSAIVVGAGVFGSSLASLLARSGWDVTVVDKYPPGHVRAASGDESRLLRFCHGSDRWYTRSAFRAVALWRELEEEAGTAFFEETGVAWFALSPDGWEADSERVLREEGIPVERLEPERGHDLFPSFDADGLAFILFEPEAGILRARDATRALLAQAVRHGARHLRGAASPARDAVEVDGEILTADRVVWACGAWLAGLFPDLVSLRVTKQDVLHFGGSLEWQTPPVPGWVEYDRAFYGLGDFDGLGVKVAPDREGPQFDPDSDDRDLSSDSVPLAREFMARRFPSLRDAPLIGARSCPYAATVDTKFIVAPHPEHAKVWILGGGSGHGFKHGPALAEYVLRLLEGASDPDPRLGLGPREPDRSLRTAGHR
jgi:glycine/D-amino acid oxidase-like deaminating enzyme